MLKMKLIDEEILKITPKTEMNGAGPKGWGWLIPDQLGLVNIEKAANIHDAQYYWSAKMGTKCRKYADEIFYTNLRLINKHESPTYLGYLARKPIIWLYYQAVCKFGGYFVRS